MTVNEKRKRTNQNLFTKYDYAILLWGLADQIYPPELEILSMRFWENKTLEEIAHTFEQPVNWVEAKLEIMLIRLKRYCVNHPDFSRNKNYLSFSA